MSKPGQVAQNALKMQPEPEPEPVANDGLGELAHAYAVVVLSNGRALAVHLEGVTAKRVERISTNETAESLPFATARCRNAMDRRTRQRLWGGL